MARRRHVHTNKSRQQKTNKHEKSSQPSFSWWTELVSTWLPNLLVLMIAIVITINGYTTSSTYTKSKPLMRVLKQAFVALVCLVSRKQLIAFYLPPNKHKTITLVVYSHVKALIVAILANSAGTTVINPLFGRSPAYNETIELVIPVYVSVEIIVGLVRVPELLIQFIIGFLVSWLKAMTIAKLAADWQSTEGAHLVGFVLVATANLFASGLTLRYIGFYTSTHRILGLSFNMLWDLIKFTSFASTIAAIAHFANHFRSLREYETEAKVLYTLVSWYAFNKYWKGPLTTILLKIIKVKQ